MSRRIRALGIAVGLVLCFSLLARHQYSDEIEEGWRQRFGTSPDGAPAEAPLVEVEDPESHDADVETRPPGDDGGAQDDDYRGEDEDFGNQFLATTVAPEEPQTTSPVDESQESQSTDEELQQTDEPLPTDEPQQTETAELPLSTSTVQTPSYDDIDWSRFAYTQYVTDKHYLCNSVMLFESLHRLGSNASRVMMYPSHFLEDPKAQIGEEKPAKLIIKAREKYGVELVPIEVQHRDGKDATWADSYTKLLAFNQTQYDRVLALDSDSVLLQPMDELFLTPPCPVAMPRAYWLLHDDPPKRILSSQLVLLQPDAVEFERIMEKTDAAGHDDYDMEIVNQLYLDSATVLPHRPYDLLTGEFRGDDHSAYLGTDREEWDPKAIFEEAKFLHFSDWPLPKPWIKMSEDRRKEVQPDCQEKDGELDCTAREIWHSIYTNFLEHRKEVCDNLL